MFKNINFDRFMNLNKHFIYYNILSNLREEATLDQHVTLAQPKIIFPQC